MRDVRAMAALASTPSKAEYVLVVEDTQTLRDAVIELLREEGVNAIGVADGNAALQFLHSGVEPPWAVLTDLVMPGLGGAELIDRLLGDSTLRRVRLVAMSASPLASAPHGVRFLRKPFHVVELLEALACR